MRILDNDESRKIDNVTLYLTVEEAYELKGSLQELLDNPHYHHSHIPSEDYQKEITVCIYNTSNLQGFDERSKRIITNDE